MKSYKIVSPFKDMDGIHKPGEPDVSLNDDDALELIALGAVEAPPTPIELTAEERLAAIITVIGQIDPNNADAWLKDGRPDITAIVAITGWKISSDERNAAWAALNEK